MLEQDLFQIINRKNKLFESDINELESELSNIIKSSSFLIIGAGGSIGQAVTKEIALRVPKTLHCIDVSENSLVELVRDLRSSDLMLQDFKTFNIDVGSKIFEDFYEHAPRYDYVLNLSALKHVRSEKDNFSLFRLVNTNIFNTVKSVNLAINSVPRNISVFQLIRQQIQSILWALQKNYGIISIKTWRQHFNI